jgi:predicted RND superfamily exporter protein
VALWVTGTTLNIQSFMGSIMAIGVAVANAILLVTFAERSRVAGLTVANAAVEGAASRLRPILMTSFAMVAGMVPMAMGVGEGGEQTAPLGRAVIGGLVGATLATLVVLPAIFSVIQRDTARKTPSLYPEDPHSPYFRHTETQVPVHAWDVDAARRENGDAAAGPDGHANAAPTRPAESESQ